MQKLMFVMVGMCAGSMVQAGDKELVNPFFKHEETLRAAELTKDSLARRAKWLKAAGCVLTGAGAVAGGYVAYQASNGQGSASLVPKSFALGALVVGGVGLFKHGTRLLKKAAHGWSVAVTAAAEDAINTVVENDMDHPSVERLFLLPQRMRVLDIGSENVPQVVRDEVESSLSIMHDFNHVPQQKQRVDLPPTPAAEWLLEHYCGEDKKGSVLFFDTKKHQTLASVRGLFAMFPHEYSHVKQTYENGDWKTKGFVSERGTFTEPFFPVFERADLWDEELLADACIKDVEGVKLRFENMGLYDPQHPLEAIKKDGDRFSTYPPAAYRLYFMERLKSARTLWSDQSVFWPEQDRIAQMLCSMLVHLKLGEAPSQENKKYYELAKRGENVNRNPYTWNRGIQTLLSEVDAALANAERAKSS